VLELGRALDQPPDFDNASRVSTTKVVSFHQAKQTLEYYPSQAHLPSHGNGSRNRSEGAKIDQTVAQFFEG